MDTTALPLLVTEIHRYKEPDRWGWHYLVPDPNNEWSIYPFTQDIDFTKVEERTNPALRGPRYKNLSNPVLETEEGSEHRRLILVNGGYRRYRFIDVPENFRNFVIRQQAPTEWRRHLTADPDNENIVVWISGEWPGPMAEVEPQAEPIYGMCTACGAIEVKLNKQDGTRDLSYTGEDPKYPYGFGCELCD